MGTARKNIWVINQTLVYMEGMDIPFASYFGVNRGVLGYQGFEPL